MSKQLKDRGTAEEPAGENGLLLARGNKKCLGRFSN